MSTLRLNLPTVLTLSRIVLIPFFVVSVYHHPVIGALVFGLASITDFLDGYLARRSGQITKFGIIMDPIADKFLVISALIVLVDMERLSAWIAIILIVREFLVTALRVVALSRDIVIPAEMGGSSRRRRRLRRFSVSSSRAASSTSFRSTSTILAWPLYGSRSSCPFFRP